MLYTCRVMTVYAAPSTRPYQRLFRIFGGGAVIVLLGIFFLSVYERVELSHSTKLVLAWVIAAITLAALVVALVVVNKEGLRKFQWELTADKIIQRYEGWPTIEIPLTAIESLHEYHGWLIIRAVAPVRQITVSSKINGFQQLKNELAGARAVTPLKVKVSPLSFLPLVLAIVAYFFLFMSHKRVVVIGAGVAALLLQGGAFYSLWRLWRGKRALNLLNPTFVLTWLLIAWIVYQRATGAM
jgi:branched-subunit amino acid transport protein